MKTKYAHLKVISLAILAIPLAGLISASPGLSPSPSKLASANENVGLLERVRLLQEKVEGLERTISQNYQNPKHDYVILREEYSKAATKTPREQAQDKLGQPLVSKKWFPRPLNISEGNLKVELILDREKAGTFTLPPGVYRVLGSCTQYGNQGMQAALMDSDKEPYNPVVLGTSNWSGSTDSLSFLSGILTLKETKKLRLMVYFPGPIQGHPWTLGVSNHKHDEYGPFEFNDFNTFLFIERIGDAAVEPATTPTPSAKTP